MNSAGIDIHQLYEAQVIARNLTSSLAFITWDICITFAQEVPYIWMTPASSWGIKPVYLFLRYYAFFSLIATQVTAISLRHKIPIALQDCRSFFLFQIISVELLIIAANIIVMTQVYALYNRRLWIALFLIGLLGLDIVAAFLVIPSVLPRVQFSPFCFITLPTSAYAIFSVLSIIPPLTSFIFILVRQIVGIHEGWGNTPLMVMLTRDSMWGVIGLILVWILNPLIGIMVGKSLVHVGHLWFMSIIPSIGCRLVLNMQRLKLPPEPTNENIILTTNVDMGHSQSQPSVEV